MADTPPVSVFVIGTRAQLIKVAPVIVACEQQALPLLLLMTGQHKETMQDLFEEFGIQSVQENAVPMSERSTVVSLVGWLPRVLIALVGRLRVLRREDARARVLVHGDTLSSALGALAAKLSRLEVWHLESGLTSGKLFDPFPEEIARRMVFRLTDTALCPGVVASAHMRARYRCQVVDTGHNTIVDSVMMATRRWADSPDADPGVPYVVASLHRFQNLFDGTRLRFLVDLLVGLSDRYRIHFVLHPATRKRLQSEGLWESLAARPNIFLSPRLGYSEFLGLASRAACVLTDGGSNQEELAVLGVPTIVMRQATERPDGLGENAVMEPDLGQDVLSFCLSGAFEKLRRPSRVGSVFGPSRQVADLLGK